MKKIGCGEYIDLHNDSLSSPLKVCGEIDRYSGEASYCDRCEGKIEMLKEVEDILDKQINVIKNNQRIYAHEISKYEEFEIRLNCIKDEIKELKDK